MLFGGDPLTNLICNSIILVGCPLGLLWLLYLAWRWLWPRLLDSARDTYRYVTGPDEEKQPE